MKFDKFISDRPHRFTRRACLQRHLGFTNITFWISALVPHDLDARRSTGNDIPILGGVEYLLLVTRRGHGFDFYGVVPNMCLETNLCGGVGGGSRN